MEHTLQVQARFFQASIESLEMFPCVLFTSPLNILAKRVFYQLYANWYYFHLKSIFTGMYQLHAYVVEKLYFS